MKKQKRELELEANVEKAASAVAALMADATFSAELARLTEAEKAAGLVCDAARQAIIDYERSYLIERQVTTGSGVYTPIFLAQAEEVIGVPYAQEATVQPGNKSASIYAIALGAIKNRILAQSQVLKALKHEASMASSVSNAAWQARSNYQRKLTDLERHASHARSELSEYLSARDSRAMRRDDGDKESAERARVAREKIAQLTGGSLKIPLENA